MADTKSDLPRISSLAAPTARDREIWRTLSEDERRAIVAAHIAEGTRDIEEGRYTDLNSEADIAAFFDRIWPSA